LYRTRHRIAWIGLVVYLWINKENVHYLFFFVYFYLFLFTLFVYVYLHALHYLTLEPGLRELNACVPKTKLIAFWLVLISVCLPNREVLHFLAFVGYFTFIKSTPVVSLFCSMDRSRERNREGTTQSVILTYNSAVICSRRNQDSSYGFVLRNYLFWIWYFLSWDIGMIFISSMWQIVE